MWGSIVSGLLLLSLALVAAISFSRWLQLWVYRFA